MKNCFTVSQRSRRRSRSMIELKPSSSMKYVCCPLKSQSSLITWKRPD
ncbi:hypothetical protein OESDEN_25436 [Oesophagostomum dentatum]|uniref:Uncharacterized protein n=1 Tax=Oesophagostomum dentatum TaxID=61180 RepID=A0A0B1RPG0_OESDE|nr:hypothetical protein OESDEN_25436 [Oesophagostomum dentatum]